MPADSVPARARERRTEGNKVPFNHLDPPAINNEAPIPSQPINDSMRTIVKDADPPHFGAPVVPGVPIEVNWPHDANPVVMQGTRQKPKRSHKKKSTK